MRNNIDSAELDRLISFSIDQSLSRSDAQKLNSLLENSAKARQRYNDLHETHTALCELFPSKILRDSASTLAEAASFPSREAAHSSFMLPNKIDPMIKKPIGFY